MHFHAKNFKTISFLESNSPPSVFVGSKLPYPLVNVGILSPLQRDEHVWVYADEKYWADQNFAIRDVLSLRKSLVNARFQTQVHNVRVQGSNLVELAKSIALAAKPVDIEVRFKRNLQLQHLRDRVVTPHGAHGGLQSAKVIGNISILPKVEQLVEDDVKAGEALQSLYRSQLDVYALSKMLSVGAFGLKKQRKLVPTRWSITATDDTIGKQILEDIRYFKQIEDYQLFVGGFMGNEYLILLFPHLWSYELFELYLPGSSWNPSSELKASTDNETYAGRKTYASNTAGGYYATRLGIVEYLHRMRRQASVLAIRLELPTYWAALGVWVCRESTRKTMQQMHMHCSSREELLNAAQEYGNAHFHFNCLQIYEKSKLLEQLKTQITLRDFF